MRKILGITLVLLAGALQADSNSGHGDAIQETITQLEALWGENQCETITVRKKGYPLISIACTGNFDRARRAKFLDVLFKNDFQLKKETYRLRPQNGMYLYKTQQGRKTIYFKLYVRGALDLWPRNPVQGKQLAIYVQNVRAATDLVRWRTLGIPVTFGVTLGRGDSDVLMKRLAEYGDEVWLAIPLEDENTDIADGALLGIGEALNGEKLAEYLKALDDDEGFQGVSPLYCSRFCKNVPALRALFSMLREKNQDKEIIMLDTDLHEQSSFYETGRIMNFRTFRAMVNTPEKRPFCPAFRSFVSLPENSAARIMAIDAGDEEAFRCLKNALRAQRPDLEFVKVSQMSVTNPFR